MNQAIPGIFEKLDGWSSHSYPNPDFVGLPEDTGRGTVRGWEWEKQKLKELGVKKDLPIFITETGWKHAEGLSYNSSLPSSQKTANYLKRAFEVAWNDNKIVAVTPFLLDYQQAPFDHFSFTKPTGQKQNDDPNYYESFLALQNLPKVSGKPVQEAKAQLIKGEVYTSIVSGESYKVYLIFKNTGQSIWDDHIKLIPITGGQELGIVISEVSKETRIEPSQEYTFKLEFKTPKGGEYAVSLNLFGGNLEFESGRVNFVTKVKSPVSLQIKSALEWKNNFAGKYILKIVGPIEEEMPVTLVEDGLSSSLDTRELLPDYEYDLTLQKPFYQSKTIHQSLNSGLNILDFGYLSPNIFPALLHPIELWKLLPFSS